MKKLNKYHFVSMALLALVLIVQLIPFTHSTRLIAGIEAPAVSHFDDETMTMVEDSPAKTWAEIPVGVTGKERSSWPSEIKFGEFKDWEPSVQEKYPLYGEKQVSIFAYVWNPAGALWGHQMNAFLLIHVLFIAFALFAFLVKNYMAKAVVAFMFGAAHIFAFVMCLVLRASEELFAYVPTMALLVVAGVAAFAVGVYFIPEYYREKAHNEEIKKSL